MIRSTVGGALSGWCTASMVVVFSTKPLVRVQLSSASDQGKQQHVTPAFLPARLPVQRKPTPQSLAPGSLSLNLRGVSAGQVPGFHAAVSDLVPKCVKVPITTKSLSEKFKFAPKKVGVEGSG